jgi:hypothetical protein
MEWSRERAISKARMMAIRTVFQNGRRLYKCDLCGGKFPMLEMHEIISRSQTIGNDTARLRSYDEHLCCLVCNDCHETAGTRENEKLCWRALYRIYGRGDLTRGYEIVKPYYDAVQEICSIITPLERVSDG